MGKEISWVLVSKMGSCFLLSHVAKLIVSVFFYCSLGLLFQEFDFPGASNDVLRPARISGMAEKQNSSGNQFFWCLSV